MNDLTEKQSVLVQSLRETVVALNILQRKLKEEGLEVDLSCYGGSGDLSPGYTTAKITRDVREIDIAINRDGE